MPYIACYGHYFLQYSFVLKLLSLNVQVCSREVVVVDGVVVVVVVLNVVVLITTVKQEKNDHVSVISWDHI